MKMFQKSLLLAIVASAAMVVGCSSQKEPANKAIADAEAALAAVRDDAARYLPSDLQGVEATIADLKTKFQSGDYKGILAAAPDLTSKLGALKDAAAAKKAEMEAAIEKAKGDWTALAADVPAMMGALTSRIDALSASKRLPKNIDAAKFESAKSAYAAAKSAWDAASAAAGSGDVLDAVGKATEAKAKGAEAMEALGMTPAAG
jgi:hypothetical protein